MIFRFALRATSDSALDPARGAGGGGLPEACRPWPLLNIAMFAEKP